MLVPVPPGVPPARVAAASDNVADAWHSVVPVLEERRGAQVLILGGGANSIGLYAAGLAVAHAASAVDYIDDDPGRREIAESFGARTGTRPAGAYDVVVEATSRAAGLRRALRALAPGGVCTALKPEGSLVRGLLCARLKFVGELGLQAAKPGCSPGEVVRALASRDQREANVSGLGEGEDLGAKGAIRLFGADPEPFDQLDGILERDGVREEQAQKPLVAELEFGHALAPQPFVYCRASFVRQAIALARARAVRVVCADDVSVVLEGGEFGVDLRERGRPEEAGAAIDGALDRVARLLALVEHGQDEVGARF
jgi:hypothetical protein